MNGPFCRVELHCSRSCRSYIPGNRSVLLVVADPISASAAIITLAFIFGCGPSTLTQVKVVCGEQPEPIAKKLRCAFEKVHPPQKGRRLEHCMYKGRRRSQRGSGWLGWSRDRRRAHRCLGRGDVSGEGVWLWRIVAEPTADPLFFPLRCRVLKIGSEIADPPYFPQHRDANTHRG